MRPRTPSRPLPTPTLADLTSFLLLGAGASLLCPPTPGLAQSDGDRVALGTYRVLHSSILEEDRVLQVHLPREYEGGAGAFPVAYLLYSDWVEGYFAQVVNDLYHLAMDRMPPAILVGVPNTQRYRDLLPWPRPGGQPGEGQADRFLRFVREELIPFVDGHYRTEPYRIMVGPQTAAVFGLYALLEAPGTFQAFILNDPCLLDHPGRSLCAELVERAATPAGAGTYFAVSQAPGGGPWPPAGLQALEAGLGKRATDGFRWRVALEPEWPFFLAPVRVREALLDLFAGYPFPSPGQASGLAEIADHYASLSRRFGFDIQPPDLVLTLAANGMMERGSFPAALETFDHLVRLYPSSMNGPWGLANLHRAMGDSATAIRYYEECLRRDPNMAPAREWIRRLKGGH
jgi:hypothetical protein